MGSRAAPVTRVVTYRDPFLPPRRHEALIRLTHLLLPTFSRQISPIAGFSASRETRELVRRHTEGPCILAPNHPTGADPIALFWLSRFSSRPFYFMAAREALEGFRGRFINRIGAFSVIRGTSDRAALKMAREVIALRRGALVLFPEGEIHEHGDHLLSLEPGVFQIGFWALEDCRKQNPAARLCLIPIAVKYLVIGEPRAAIEQALERLEKAVLAEPPAERGWYRRLLGLALAMMQHVEQVEGLGDRSEQSFDGRVEAIRTAISRRLYRWTGAAEEDPGDPVERLHRLHNMIRNWTGQPPPADAPLYARRLYEVRLEESQAMMMDFDRIHNLVGVHHGYLSEMPTYERVLDLIGHLEREVFGKPITNVPREAAIEAGEPIYLDEYLGEYEQNRRALLTRLVCLFEAELRSKLGRLAARSRPVPADLLGPAEPAPPE